MKKNAHTLFLLLLTSAGASSQTFSLESVKGYPFPTELTASSQGSRIAWALDELGRRNVYVAEGPDFKPRKLTNYTQDDGQEITSLSVSTDGKWVVYAVGNVDMEGSVVLVPGAFAIVYTSTASGASGGAFSFSWEEVPA